MTDMNKPRIIVKELFYLLMAAFIVRLIPIWFGADSTDIILYKYQGNAVLQHLNIYSHTHKLFPYSPVSMFIPPFCAILSVFLEVPFYIMMKLPALITDVLITMSIYIVMVKKEQRNAFWWGVFYALNPVSILISSFHGNIMPVPVLFTFLAYGVLLFGIEKNWRLSALLLGLGIGLRGYPILLLPLFIINLKFSFEKKVKYLAYAILPVALSFIPFLLLDYKSVFGEVFAYSGRTDYGLAAIFRAVISLKKNALLYNLPNNLDILLLNFTKALFLILYIIILFLSRRKRLITSISLVFFTFYFVYAGVASQYLIWILPFIFLAKERVLKYYLIAATWALVNFYLLHHPKIIFGRFTPIDFPLRELLMGEAISMSLLWIVCLLGMIFLMARGDKNKDIVFL